MVQLHTFVTSAPDGGHWSTLLPGRFTPLGKRVGTKGLGGLQSQAGRFWIREKSLVPASIRTPYRRAVASRYTDCATLAPIAFVRTSDLRKKLV